ncbi:MAG: DUF6279 family lipoprotein [Burkholderiales bacterium]
MIARLAAALLAALAAGCSQLEFAYKHADVWLRWKAAAYVDLEGDQSREFEARVAAFHGWHRTRALPHYARLAEEAAARLERGATLEDMAWGYDALRRRMRAELRRAGEELGGFGDGLNDAQLASIERRFAEDNRKFAEQWLSGTPDERRARRLERVVERLGDWLGPLDEGQLARVRAFNDEAPYNAALRDRDRRRLQAEFLALLRAREGERRLGEWLSAWDAGRDAALAEASRETTRAFLAMLADLSRGLSEAQRERVTARLRDYARGFQVLAEAR